MKISTIINPRRLRALHGDVIIPELVTIILSNLAAIKWPLSLGPSQTTTGNLIADDLDHIDHLQPRQNERFQSSRSPGRNPRKKDAQKVTTSKSRPPSSPVDLKKEGHITHALLRSILHGDNTVNPATLMHRTELDWSSLFSSGPVKGSQGGVPSTGQFRSVEGVCVSSCTISRKRRAIQRGHESEDMGIRQPPSSKRDR
ncbi:hypothetical protein VTK26DRAFT_6841 [Humicola hyalothermophila]